jgi:hypothetical protein
VFEQPQDSLESLGRDLKGAGNIAELIWGAESENIILAETADAA